MALCRTVGLNLKCVKSVLVNPCLLIPSSANLQVRHAARKGFRDKKKKNTEKEAASLPQEFGKLKGKFVKVEKTLNLKKPEPPSDDVFIKDSFNYKKFPLPEIIGFHQEYHHPTVYNNPDAPILVKIEIDMTGKKKTQFLKPFSGTAAIPHPFVIKHKKEVLVLCSPEDKELALSCGASVAGGLDVVKKIQEGIIQPTLYDYIICHSNFLPHLTPIRTLLKNQLPRAKSGTLTNDLKSSIHRFLHGIEYSCAKYGAGDDFGAIQCSIGTVNMEKEHLENNFKALVEDIEKNRPPRPGDFITWVWCMSPPSTEEFSVDLTNYIQPSEIDVDDYDD